MRTSRLARDTARVVKATASRRHVAASTSLHTMDKQEEEEEEELGGHKSEAEDEHKGTITTQHNNNNSDSDSPLSSLDSDFEDPSKEPRTTTITTRKRNLPPNTNDSPSTTRVKLETTSTSSTPVKPPTRPRRTPAKRTKDPSSGTISTTPPTDWEATYALTKQMRAQVLAPVDTMGCEALADTAASPKDQRFQTLVSLMLSSQTKDTVTAVAVRDLQQKLPGGLSVRSILDVEAEVLNGIIGKVGFHNIKTKSLKATAGILRERYEGDIPDTIEGLMGLPGVGPKMSYLCMSAAWGRDEGIGVDVHVHRITNLWRWHRTKTPEETRAALEAWLPREKWHDINHLLVGFGQTWCPPAGRKCDKCLLAEEKLCPSAVLTKTTKMTKVEEEAKVKVEYSP